MKAFAFFAILFLAVLYVSQAAVIGKCWSSFKQIKSSLIYNFKHLHVVDTRCPFSNEHWVECGSGCGEITCNTR